MFHFKTKFKQERKVPPCDGCIIQGMGRWVESEKPSSAPQGPLLESHMFFPYVTEEQRWFQVIAFKNNQSHLLHCGITVQVK